MPIFVNGKNQTKQNHGLSLGLKTLPKFPKLKKKKPQQYMLSKFSLQPI